MSLDCKFNYRKELFFFSLSFLHCLVVLVQDDFLPRTATPLEDIFKSIFWYVSLLSWLFLDLWQWKRLLPRTSAIKLLLISLKPGIDALDSLPCLLFLVCLRDTFIPEGRKLRDQRRLYAPGRMYHIVERKFCRYRPLILLSLIHEDLFFNFFGWILNVRLYRLSAHFSCLLKWTCLCRFPNINHLPVFNYSCLHKLSSCPLYVT